MDIDIDLMATGRWTSPLRMQDLTAHDIRVVEAAGFTEPVLVRSTNSGAGQYEILGNPKNWFLAQKLQIPAVPVFLLDHIDKTALDLRFKQTDVSKAGFIDKAIELRKKIDTLNLSLVEAGKMVGKSRSTVCNMMRILKLDSAVISTMKKHSAKKPSDKNKWTVEIGHAKAFVGLEVDQQHVLLERVIEGQLSVRQTEVLARQVKHGESPSSASGNRPATHKSVDVVRLEKQLTEYLGASTTIDQGKLAINYHGNLDILQGILEKIGQTGRDSVLN